MTKTDSVTTEDDGNRTYTDCPYCGEAKAVAPSVIIPALVLNGSEVTVEEETSDCMACGEVIYF